MVPSLILKYYISKSVNDFLHCVIFCSTLDLDILIPNLGWALAEAVGRLVSRVEALLGRDAAPAPVRVEPKLEAARRLNAILAKVLKVPCRAILPNILCSAPGKTKEGSPRRGHQVKDEGVFLIGVNAAHVTSPFFALVSAAIHCIVVLLDVFKNEITGVFKSVCAIKSCTGSILHCVLEMADVTLEDPG